MSPELLNTSPPPLCTVTGPDKVLDLMRATVPGNIRVLLAPVRDVFTLSVPPPPPRKYVLVTVLGVSTPPYVTLPTAPEESPG